MTRFSFLRFTLPTLLLSTACLYGQQAEQLKLVWTGPYLLTGGGHISISAAADGVYVAGRVFVYKYDLTGHQLWVRQFDSPQDANTFSTSVAAAADGVYVCGYTYTTLPGFTGTGDSFLVKFDVNGNQLWSLQFGGGSNASGVSVAADGVYVSGWHYVRKFDFNGNELWAQDSGDSGATVSAAPDGFYVGGSTGDPVLPMYD